MYGNQNYADDFFVYTVPFGNLAASANAVVSIQIQADSDFLWLKSSYYGILHGAADPQPDSTIIPMLLQITDTGSGRQLFSAPTPWEDIAGFKGLPYVLPIPRIFLANSSVQFTLTNMDGASEYDNLFFTMQGAKKWQFKS